MAAKKATTPVPKQKSKKSPAQKGANQGAAEGTLNSDDPFLKEQNEKIAAAETACDQLADIGRRSFDGWLTYARGIDAIKNVAMFVAVTKQPQGPKYREHFKTLLSEHPKLNAVRKTTRHAALKILGSLDEVNAWRKTLPPEQLPDLNHPKTVWKHFEATRIPNVEKPTKKPKSESSSLRESVRRLEEEKLKLLRENERLVARAKTDDFDAPLEIKGNGSDHDDDTRIETMATTIYDRCGRSAERIRRLIEALQRITNTAAAV